MLSQEVFHETPTNSSHQPNPQVPLLVLIQTSFSLISTNSRLHRVIHLIFYPLIPFLYPSRTLPHISLPTILSCSGTSALSILSTVISSSSSFQTLFSPTLPPHLPLQLLFPIFILPKPSFINSPSPSSVPRPIPQFRYSVSSSIIYPLLSFPLRQSYRIFISLLYDTSNPIELNCNILQTSLLISEFPQWMMILETQWPLQ